MALFDGLRRQLRSVIQWENPSDESLFYRWSENGDEIKNSSKLIVGPGQGCIFVYQGKVEAVLEEECMIDLKTDNIPFWTTISKFMQFFESEHKVGIYFFKRTNILDQKWGTTSVIRYDDPKYKFPVGLRMYGNYSFRIKDAEGFFVNVIGGAATFAISDFREVMGDRIVHPLSDFLAEAKYSYAEIDANRNEIAEGMQTKLDEEFGKLGFDITDFRIEGTSFDEDTEKRIDRIADMSAEAQAAAAAGLNFAQMQQLEAMREAARNEGGGAGMGMGLGAGLGFGNMMAGAMANQQIGAQPGGGQGQSSQQPAPSADDPMEKLKKLKTMFEADLISEEEYNTKKKQILDTM